MIGFSRSLSFFSEALFRGLEVTDQWIALPQKVSSALHYRQSWTEYRSPAPRPGAKLWIHGASLGELEDLAAFFSDPELLRIAGFKTEDLILTSSSPSAGAALSKWRQNLGPFYAGPLPPEKQGELRRFLESLDIDTFILSHSDVWPMLFEELAVTVKHFLWLPSRLSQKRSLLQKLYIDPQKTWIGSRSQEMEALIGLSWKDFQSSFVGNPRLDRIYERIERQQQKKASDPAHVLESYRASPDPQKLSLLGASFWPEDASILSEALSLLSPQTLKLLQIVIIPHESKDRHLHAYMQSLLPQARILAVEGILLEAYENFTCAFVGGAFGAGLHNVLEPALWGIPTLCGPKLKKQPEAPRLIRDGQLFSISEAQALAAWLEGLGHSEVLASLKEKALQVATRLQSERGATQRLAHSLASLRSTPT